GDADGVEHQDRDGVGAHAQPLPLRPEHEADHVDDGEESAEGGQVDVGVVGAGQHGLAGQDGGEQEQHRQECVAAEDVADGELVVAHAGGRQPGGQFRQGGGGSQDGGAEKDAGHAEPAEQFFTAAFDEHAGDQGDGGGDA